MTESKPDPTAQSDDEATPKVPAQPNAAAMPKEIGGPKGLEPTRYGDWERNGRCTDF